MNRFAWRGVLVSGIALVAGYGVCLSRAEADVVLLKDGQELKGLVVEEHDDRVVLSTADGEIKLKKSIVVDVRFDDPAYNFLSLGREREKQQKYGEALSYYEKAYQLNPHLEDAKAAAIAIRSRFWSNFGQGPVNEVDKQQAIENAYRSTQTLEEQMQTREDDMAKEVWDTIGIEMKPDGDWLGVSKVKLGGQAQRKGIKKGDRFLSIDGASMKYLNKTAVGEKILKPKFTSFKAGLGRGIALPASGSRKLKDIGLKLRQGYDGIEVAEVRPGSDAEKLGFKSGDEINQIQGVATRYLGLNRAVTAIEKSDRKKKIVIEIEREMSLDRK